MKTLSKLLVSLVAALVMNGAGAQVAADKERIPSARAAMAAPSATQAPIMAAAKAGNRLVAVGGHGVVLLSDDDGKSFRQASHVPVQSTLTGAHFIDETRGWAVGHEGIVLGTSDGGENWKVLHKDERGLDPLLSVWFQDAERGIAVGQFGQLLVSADGGRTWEPADFGDDEGLFDRHFNGVFGDGGQRYWVVGEQGTVLRSDDGGASWQRADTGRGGSLWNGTRLANGVLITAGMRGHLYRSADDGASWTPVETGIKDPFTGIAEMDDGRVVVVGLGGTVLTSTDSGASYQVSVRSDRAPLSAVAPCPGEPALFALTGVVAN